MVAQRMSSQEIKNNWPWDTKSLYSHCLNSFKIPEVSQEYLIVLLTNFSGILFLASGQKKRLFFSVWPLHPFFVQLFSKEKKSTSGDGKEVPFTFLGWDFIRVIFLTWGYIRSDTGTWKTLNMHNKLCTQSCSDITLATGPQSEDT